MKLFISTVTILVIIILYYALTVRHKIAISKKIVQATMPFDMITSDKTKSVLVLGDSTAYGVGANNKDESVPGLFSKKVEATYVENYAVSGAVVKDLRSQIAQAKSDKYDYVLVQIGGNDIVAGHDPGQTTEELGQILKTLPAHTKLVVICCGSVGDVTIIPWFFRSYYANLTLQYHTEFGKVIPQIGGIYVNLYDEPSVNPFLKYPEIYLAKDEFHPSTKGYELWFKKIEKIL